MKIKLTEQEIAEIVKEWAMQMYRTKNVSVMYEIDLQPAELIQNETSQPSLHQAKLKSIGIEIEVILADGDYTGAASSLANEAIKRVQEKHGVKYETTTNADFSPRFDQSGIPLS